MVIIIIVYNIYIYISRVYNIIIIIIIIKI